MNPYREPQKPTSRLKQFFVNRVSRVTPGTVFLAAVLLAGITLAATPALRVNGVKFGAQDNSVFVTAYGATGNGSTDDSTAIAAAITALGATPSATLVFPSGTYKTTGIAISNVTGLRIRGEGAILSGTVEATSVLTLTNCTHCEISGFQIKHATTSARNATGNGILINNSTDVKVHDNYVSNVCSIGIMIHGTSSYVTASDNYVTATLADGISAAFGATDVSIVGNHVKDSGDDAISIVGYNSTGTINKRVAVSGNTVYFSGANNAHGIVVAGADGVSVTGNVIGGTNYSGIAVTSTAAFNVLGTSNVQISGNEVSDVILESGIYVWADNATYVLTNVNITGNTTKNTPNAGIRVWGTVANAVFSVSAVGNKIYTTTADDGIAYLGVVEGAVIGNSIFNPWKFGVDVNAACSNIQTGWNNIYHPNQINAVATTYGSYNASGGIAEPEFITADGGKSALLDSPSLQLPGTIRFPGQITLNGGVANAGSSAIDFSGGTGIFKPPTGVATFGGSSNAFTNSVAFNGGLTASGATSNNFSGSSGAFQTSSGTNTLNGAVVLNNVALSYAAASSANVDFSNTSGTLTWGTGTATFGGTINTNGTLNIASGMRRKMRTVSNAGATFATSDSIVAHTALAAARVDAVSCTFGSSTAPFEFEIIDLDGTASGVNTITLTPSSGTIDGAASKVVINTARGFYRFISDGTNCHSD